MVLVGLTGGIGSGKSTVAKYLEELGAAHIDADKVGHDIYRQGTPGWSAVVGEFGNGVLLPDGEVDRKKLAAAVFGSPEKLARLTSAVHPLMKKRIAELAGRLHEDGIEIIFVEGAVIIEAGWEGFFDELWLVTAPETAMVERVKASRNVNDADIRARIRSQMSNEERKKHANVVIENDGDLAALRAKVRQEWESLLRRYGLNG